MFDNLTAADVTAIFTALLSVSTALSTLMQYQHRNRWEQAESISTWEGKYLPDNHDAKVSQKAFIANNSRSPVYDVAISYGINRGRGHAFTPGNDYQTFLAILPPGLFVTDLPPVIKDYRDKKLGLSISFRDINGRFWRRDATGVLTATAREWQGLQIKAPFDNWAELENV